jgi:hypothetical protein
MPQIVLWPWLCGSWIYNYLFKQKWVRVVVFNVTFNNISLRSWRSVLLEEETGVPGENNRTVTSHWQALSDNVVSSTSSHERDSNHNPNPLLLNYKYSHIINNAAMTFILSILHNPYQRNSISGVIDRGFEPLLGQTKDYKIGIGCFSYKHAVSV